MAKMYFRGEVIYYFSLFKLLTNYYIMKVEKKDLEKSQIELQIELSVEEFKLYIKKGAAKVAKEVKIDGFRPGQVPYDILKQKIGEMTILEEAGRIAIDSTLEKAIKENVVSQPIGSPKVDITKLAPDNPFSYKVVLAILPEIKLSDYKGLKVKQKNADIKDEEVDKILSDMREMRAKEVIAAREIKSTDKVITDIAMFLDKVPLEGGQNKDTAIIVGKNYIVPGFDKKLLGAKKGDVLEFKLEYPRDFHMKNLAGKMVEFKVTIKEVFKRELPELNDEFAVNLGMGKIEELKVNIRKNTLEQKKREVEQFAEKEMLEKLVEKARFGDIPEMLIEHEADTMMHELEHTVVQQGAKFEDYLASIKKTRDQLILDLLPEAVKRIKVSLLIREITEAEKINVSSEELNNYISSMRKHYENINTKEAKEFLKKTDSKEYKNYVLNILTSRKVMDKLREWNIAD